MKVILLSFILTFFSFLNASLIGTVEKVNGSVKVKSENSFKKSRVKSGLEIKKGDLISTSKRASSVIKLIDGSRVVLDASSSIYFDSSKNMHQKDGKVYYKITSRDAKNSLKVKTPFAIIGVKGTKFIVDVSDDKGSVALKEGLVGVQSMKEEFELYRKKVKEQFDDFMKQQQQAFNEYKQVHDPGFVEITKEFDMKSGNRVSFDGNRVDEKEWNKNDDEEFKRFEEMINSLK